MHLISRSWDSLIAKQLRLPSGLLASVTGNSMNKANKLLYRLIFDNLHINDGDRVLEIGFGNGKYFADLNNKASRLQLFGLDHSAKMVAAAIKKNRALHRAGKLNVFVGSSDKMPFENESLDVIYCINVIYFWENPEVDLKEIYRVLKPGGFFYTGFRPKDNLSKFSFTKFGFTLYTEEEWMKLNLENGFQVLVSLNGKSLEREMNMQNTPFESLCMISKKIKI